MCGGRATLVAGETALECSMATERSATQKPRGGPGEDNHRVVGAPPAPRKQTQPELFLYGDQLGGLQRALQLDQDILTQPTAKTGP